jgi:hypothetical protein
MMRELWERLHDEREDVDEDRGRMRPVNEVIADLMQLAERERAVWLGEGYDDYLRSSHWINLRAMMRARAGGCCKRCGCASKRLEIHHLTYERIGRELESDLIALCPGCHAEEHGK